MIFTASIIEQIELIPMVTKIQLGRILFCCKYHRANRINTDGKTIQGHLGNNLLLALWVTKLQLGRTLFHDGFVTDGEALFVTKGS